MITVVAILMQVAPVWVGKFTAGETLPATWRVVRVGHARPTAYRISRVAGRTAIEARVDGSMALLARPITVDLAQTPILCWRWFVDRVVAKGNIKKKSGNDFAARVYVGFDMPESSIDRMTRMKLEFARSLLGANLPDAALTYVWDNHSPVGTAIRSPYTSRQELVVAQSGGDRIGQWVSERANIAGDFARAFGGKPGRAVQLAVASDGDNTHSTGQAAFADFHFVPQDQACDA